MIREASRTLILLLLLFLGWMPGMALAGNEVFVSSSITDSEATYVVKFETATAGTINRVVIVFSDNGVNTATGLGRVMIDNTAATNPTITVSTPNTVTVDFTNSTSLPVGTDFRIELFKLTNPTAATPSATVTTKNGSTTIETLSAINFAMKEKGDITAVIAGSGLSGGGTSGDVTLNVDTNYVQRRVTATCPAESAMRVIDVTGGAVTCEPVGDITAVNTPAGSGLSGGATSGAVTLSVATGGITSAMIADGAIAAVDVNSAQIQKRVTGNCAAGSSIRAIAEDGTTVTCEPDDVGVGGSGTVNYISKFTASTTIGNSSIFESGGNVGIGTTSPVGLLNVGTGQDSQVFIGATADPGWARPAVHMGIAGSAGGSVYSDPTGGASIATSSVYNNGTNDIRSGTDTVGKIQVTGDDIFIQTAGGGIIGATISWTTIATFRPSGNVGIGTTTPTSRLDVNGTLTATTKNFKIDHPLEPDKKLLVHSALEGPEVAVYYRGEAQLENGDIVITLPSYFEALTRKEQRTVQLTPIKGWAPLYVADETQDGRFSVKTANGGNPTQRFYWEVKAVRADVDPLVVEKLKGDMKVAVHQEGAR